MRNINCNHYCLINALTVVLLFSTPALAKIKCNAPPKANVQWVSPNAHVNGMSMEIKRFEVANKRESDVIDFYRYSLWPDSEIIANDMGPWKMIGVIQNGQYCNIQVQNGADGGAWGYISLSNLPALFESGKVPKGSQGQGFPKMNGSTVINDYSYKDLGQKSRVLLIRNNFSVDSNARFYSEEFVEGRGMGQMMNQVDKNGDVAQFYSRGNKLIYLTIGKHENSTSVVASEVEHGF